MVNSTDGVLTVWLLIDGECSAISYSLAQTPKVIVTRKPTDHEILLYQVRTGQWSMKSASDYHPVRLNFGLRRIGVPLSSEMYAVLKRRSLELQ